MLPKTNVYFQVTREKRTQDRSSNPSDSMMEFFNKSEPIDKNKWKSESNFINS